MCGRREFLLGTATAGTTAIAGCTSSGSVETLSWEEAFQEHLTDNDASVLDPTPINIKSVTTEDEVKTALAVLGWTEAGMNASTETVSQLDGFATIAEEAQEAISPTLIRLNDVTELVDEMKDTSALGVSVWDALVTAKPPLEGFDATAREVESQLEDISNKLEHIEVATGDMSAQIEEIKSQQTTDYSTFPQTVESAITVTADLSTDVQDANDRISNIEELTADATDAAGDLPAMNRQVSSTFGSLNSAIVAVGRQFTGMQSEIETLQSAVDDLRDGAGYQANQRFEPISSDATGSVQQMDVKNVDTTVEAYQSN